MFWFLAVRHVGFYLPDQGSNPHPLHWKAKSTTGPPGKSPIFLLKISTQCLIFLPTASFLKFSLWLAFLALVCLVRVLSHTVLLLLSLFGRFVSFNFFLFVFFLKASATLTLFSLCGWFFLLSQS